MTTPKRIYNNRPLMVGSELKYIEQAVDTMHTAGDGPFSFKCAAILEQALQAARVLMTPSCTDALELSALLLDLDSGDEVIIPSFAFPSTAGAFALRGARTVFADIRPDTLNLDESLLEGKITPRTKAIVPLHYAGVGCEMDAIRMSERHGVAIVEDNAHGLFGSYRDRPLGSFGCMSTLSFHETKNFICGEGGALAINDESLIERAEIMRDKGTNRQQLFRGQVDKYTWMDLGSSFVLSDLLAAFLLAQLEGRDPVQARRKQVWDLYDAGLRDWSAEHGVGLPTVPAHCVQTYHMYFLVVPSLEIRQRLIDYLKQRGVDAIMHYQPLHLSKKGRECSGGGQHCPVSASVADRLLRLPFHRDLTDEDQQRVVDEIQGFFRTHR